MIPVEILAQPDDVTCGPTCLHAVLQHFGERATLPEVIDDVDALEDGGTLAVYLGVAALRRGYRARLYSYNLKVFDPSWAGMGPDELQAKLEAQLRVKSDPRIVESTLAYRQFLGLGGELAFEDLTVAVLERYLQRGIPLLTGLSATYLYNTKRELAVEPRRMVSDDVRGEPQGHFVVLCGFEEGKVVVADPYKENPISHDHYYEVDAERLVKAILLGIVTYDANLLAIFPTEPSGAEAAADPTGRDAALRSTAAGAALPPMDPDAVPRSPGSSP